MQKKYHIGYVPGVFDLFHIGHLNLLKKSKEYSEYLIAGVLTDELAVHFKHKLPVIPFEERMVIVDSVRYVDEVIPVTFQNTKKIDAWRQIHFDCHFSGDDHGVDWTDDIKQLQEVNAAMEFFSYTKGISSTGIKQLLQQDHQDICTVDGRIAIYGAGKRGQALKNQIFKNKTAEVVLWMDQKWQYYCRRGYEVESVDMITNVDYDKVVVAIKDINMALKARIELRKRAVPLEKIVMWTDIK